MSATIGDIYEVGVLYDGPNGRSQNNFGFLCVTNVAGNAQAALASAFRAAMVKNTAGGLLNLVVNDLSVSTITVMDVKPGALATYESSAAAVPGLDTEDPLPPQCAVVYSLHTGLRGRSYRGRFYLPGPSEQQQAGGTLIGSIVTAHQAVATNLLAVFGPAGTNGDWRLSVISRVANGVPRAEPVATQVTAITIDPIIRTQRRRVTGVGA